MSAILDNPAPKGRRKYDAYYTPPEYTLALLDRFRVSRMHVLEPCHGDGAIADLLVEAGASVRRGDVNPDADSRLDYVGDFLNPDLKVGDFDAIITNPPFLLAPAIIRKAFDHAPVVAALLRITFLEPCEKKEASRRMDILERLQALYVLPRRSFTGGPTDSATAAWFVFGEDSPRYMKGFDFVSEREIASLLGQVELL